MARARRAALVLAAALGATVAAAAALLALDRLLPMRLDRYATTSTVVLDERGSILRAFTTADGAWRLPATPADVDPAYLALLRAYEDKRFARHIGVDPLALARAAGQWIATGHVVSGGSTLTMQTARLLEPHPRGLGGKIVEMLRALQLEWHHSK